MNSTNNPIQRTGFSFSGAGTSNPADFLDMEKKRIGEGIEILKDEIRDTWNRRHSGEPIFPTSVASANQGAVDFLLSSSLVGIYDEIARANGLDSRQRDAIPHIVWKFFLEGKISETGEMLLMALQINPAQKDTFLNMINEKVLRKLSELNSVKFVKKEAARSIASISGKQEKSGVSKISLREALLEYKKLGDQAVTSEPIKLRVFPELVRPSIKNWVADYHDHLGAGKHTTIERGNFLFHSDNGKKLSTLERRKLAEILKSLDEDVVVSIDSENERMIFENVAELQETNQKPQQTFVSAQAENIQSANFTRPVMQNPGQSNFSAPKTPSFASDEMQKNQNSFQTNVSRTGIADVKTNTPIEKIGSFHPVAEDNYIQNLRKNISAASLSPASSQDMEKRSSWNPAEAVKRRMEEEVGNGVSPKMVAVERKENSSEDVKGGRVTFSSPQVLPVEKNNSDLMKNSSNDFSQPVSNPSFGSEKISGGDDLMEKIRELNKNRTQSPRPNLAPRISPTKSFSSDDVQISKGNVVDLR